MIHEIIVVEGKHDVSAVRRAIAAECIPTGGYAFGPDVVARLTRAGATRGLIVLTDPDAAGEQIRRRVVEIAVHSKFPCKHAFIARTDCTVSGDIGVENASPSAIRDALIRARATSRVPRSEFTLADLLRCGLDGTNGARERRMRLGARLSIGYGNARQLLARLNHLDVTREEFETTIAELLTIP